MSLGFHPSLRLWLGKNKIAPTDIGICSLDEYPHPYCRWFPFFGVVTHWQHVR